MKNPLESEIQNTICEWLTLKGIWFWRQNTAPSFYKAGNELRFRKMGKYARKGIPDITLFHNGQVKFIEVKRKGMKQSDEQVEFEKQCKSHGITYILAYNLSDVEKGL